MLRSDHCGHIQRRSGSCSDSSVNAAVTRLTPEEEELTWPLSSVGRWGLITSGGRRDFDRQVWTHTRDGITQDAARWHMVGGKTCTDLLFLWHMVCHPGTFNSWSVHPKLLTDDLSFWPFVGTNQTTFLGAVMWISHNFLTFRSKLKTWMMETPVVAIDVSHV